MGIVHMGDILTQEGNFRTWADLLPDGGDRLGERAFLSLLSNLHQGPLMSEAQGLTQMHFESVGPNLDHVIWEFLVPPAETTSNWTRICSLFSPVRAFNRRGGTLSISRVVLPFTGLEADRVLIRFQAGKAGRFTWFGKWNGDSAWMEQFGWKDETPLLHTSTGQLRKMQSARRFVRHKALGKWETQLNALIPENVWMTTWLPGRSSCENAFLWQLVYRVIATQRWRFPERLAEDD